MVMQLKGSRCFAEPEVTDTPILKKHKDSPSSTSVGRGGII